MASIRKVGTKFRAEVCVKGIRESRYFTVKARARTWAADREAEIREGVIQTDKTLADAFDKYAAEVSPKHKGERWERLRLEALKRRPLADYLIGDITAADVARYRDARLAEVTAGTVRREMGLINSVFTVAKNEWLWVASNPTTAVKKPPSPPSRDRIISPNEIEALSAELTGQYRTIFLLALETGMRMGEICGLQSADIHDKHLTLHDTKNGTKRAVPLSLRARELIREAPFETTPANASAVFYKTRKALGIDCTFHDTRHTALTRLAGKLNVLELARMVGMSLKTLMIYYNERPETIADKLD